MAPLDDAELVEIALASSEDIARHQAALDLRFPENLPPLVLVKPEWPTLRLSFRSERPLFDPSDLVPTADLYLCDEEGEERHLYGFGMPGIVWQNRFVNPRNVQAINAALEAGAKPQKYEVFFDYAYWDQEERPGKTDPVKLLPLPSDLCLALYRSHHPFGSSVGRPLRISKEAVNNAVGGLPRSLSIP